MDEVLMNGFWILLGAGIVTMTYYYGYCRGDRKRYDLMKESIKRAAEEHWKITEEAFRAGYKAGRAKKKGVDTAYKDWSLTPLKGAFLKVAIESTWKVPNSDIIPMGHKEEPKSAPEQKTIPAAEPPAKEPDHDCQDCVHSNYDIEDSDPKTYVFVCKKGKCTTALTCPEFQKKLSTPSDCNKGYHTIQYNS